MYQYELETGMSHEGECEFASEYESEEFLPLLAPVLKMAAPMAIRAIGGLFSRRRRRQREFELEYEIPQSEWEYEGEYEGDPFIGNLLSGLGLGEGELEYEGEFELQTPISNEYELMMENLAYRAAHSESEAEAEAFLGALIPLAARLLPTAARAVTSVAPSLIRGVSRVGRALYRSPQTRQLLQTVPTVLKGTVRTIANQVHQGQPISSTTALRALAGNVANVLDSPQKVTQVMRRSHRARHQQGCKTPRKRRPASV